MPTSSILPISCILFDLDGTLVDTAPDLLNALNVVLAADGLEACSMERARPIVSHGHMAMLRAAFGEHQTEIDAKRRQRLFLDYYTANICRVSALFETMPEVLETLEAQGKPWGIVTNKPEYLTWPLLDALGLRHRAGSVIGGDTLEVAKPHPKPLLVAAQQCGVAPQHCLYVGDAERDIIAGRGAGMATLVAAYGYLSDTDQPHEWQADGLVDSPGGILAWLGATATQGQHA